MKKLLLLLLLTGTAYAADGPLYPHEDPQGHREFQAVYDQLKSPRISTGIAQNFTIVNASATSLTAETITVNDINYGGTIPLGAVKQVVFFSSGTKFSTTTTWADAGVAVSITPLCLGSTIYVMASVETDIHIGTGETGTCDLRWLKGASALTSANTYYQANAAGGAASVAEDFWKQVPTYDYDVPVSSGVAVTYKLQLQRQNAGTCHVNENSFAQGITSGMAIEVGPNSCSD